MSDNSVDLKLYQQVILTKKMNNLFPPLND